MIRFQCPSCRGALQVADGLAGSAVACGHCRQALRVPAPRPGVPRSAPPPPPPPRPGRTVAARRGRSAWPLAIALSTGTVLLIGSMVAAVVVLQSKTAEPSESAPVAKAPPEKKPIERPPPKGGKPPVIDKGAEAKEKDRPPPPEKKPGPDKEPRPPIAKSDDLVEALLAQLNEQRRQEGAAPLTLNADHAAGCREHAAYLARHGAASQDQGPHDQDDSLEGATEAGRAAARAATLSTREPKLALQAWLKAPAHRALLLSPALKTVGFGVARDGNGKWTVVADFIRGRTAGKPSASPVIFPADGQRDVPLVFPGNEVPDPLPMTRDKLAGYPITATFPRGARVADARAWLEDEAGIDAPLWFSTPARPANEKHAALQQNTLCLIAKKPLRAGTRYVVRLEASVNGAAWSYTGTFLTQPAVEGGRKMYERAVARVNRYRKAAGLAEVSLDAELSRHAAAHARYVVRHLDGGAGNWIADEDPNKEGYTEGGARVGRRSAIRLGGGSGPVDAVDWMMSSVLNRHLVLFPGAKTVALGAAQHAPRGWVWVYHVPPAELNLRGAQAFLYPGKGQKDVLLHFGWGARTLVPKAPADAQPGFPITARFLGARDIRNSSAALTDGEGKPVECWVHLPEKPLAPTGSYRQIILLPKAPLKGGTTYTVSMGTELDGKEWSEKWAFTTYQPDQYRADVANELVRRLNVARALAGLKAVALDDGISKGCQAHAEYVARNLDNPKVQGLNIHDEDPTLPGYTKEGARAGPRSVIAVISDPLDSVAGWLATLYHRIPVLDPALKRVGYGQALHPLRGWVTVMDAGSGR